jgi:hypothetical protein
MRKIYCWLFLATFITACNDHKKTGEVSKDPATTVLEKLLGSFVGTFGENKITMLITHAQSDKIEGHTIVGGNDRPFTGSFKEVDGTFSVTAKEPGSDPNDGVFDFNISTADPNVVVGTWKPFDANKEKKYYRLQRREFKYSADEGTYPQASQRELKDSDLENMMKSDLDMMRNEIFARHGYSFKNKGVRGEFDEEDWYVPNNVDVRKELTAVEKKNIELIKRYAKYADDYSDEFGR